MIAPAAALVLLLAAPSSAQVFAGAAGLAESLDSIRAQTAALKAAPKPRRHRHALGRRDSAETPPAPPSGDAMPDPSPYAVKGMDISHYEGAIDWDQVKTAAGMSFVYMKATESTDYTDETFATNWAGASRAGLMKGAYHFYDFCKGGAEQAALFVKTVPAEAGALPPTIDLEQSNSCAKLPAKDAFRKDLAVFIAALKSAYKVDPVLYVNGSIYSAYFQGENDPDKIWIADIRHQSPQVPGGAAWAFWQYDWHGKVPGITGEVDLDVFNGTPEVLASLAAPAPGGTMLAWAR